MNHLAEAMPYTEADTRAKLIDPARKERGWTEDHIRREITQPKVVLDDTGSAARKAGGGRVDYVLRYRLNPGTQPVAFAFIEAKAEDKTPGSGLEQVKEYTGGGTTCLSYSRPTVTCSWSTTTSPA